MAGRKATSIHQLKVTLQGTRPPIWRRLQVPSSTRLDVLHPVLQIAMGWQDYHLHEFQVAGREYGVPDPDWDFKEVADERRGVLGKLAPNPGDRFTYLYDFGDGWDHIILVEKVLPAEPGVRYPRCLTGRRACPPEDCGGVWGFEEFRRAIADPAHEEHESLLEWAGGAYDPAAFDLEAVNRALLRPEAWLR